nr:hypothetical protein [Oscillatoria laete-virens]
MTLFNKCYIRAVILAQSGRHLSALEAAILRGAIASQTDEEIADLVNGNE